MRVSEVLAAASQYLAVLEKYYSSHTSQEVANTVKSMIDDVKRHISVLLTMSGISGSQQTVQLQRSQPSVAGQHVSYYYQDPLFQSMYGVVGNVLGLTILQVIVPFISEVLGVFGKKTSRSK